MKLTLRHHENTTTLTFSGGGYIYASESDLAPPKSWGTRLIDDGNHQGIVRSWDITLMDMPNSAKEGALDATIHRYACDVRHLFKVILVLRERHAAALKAWVEAGHRDWKFKRADDVLDLDRFQTHPETFPRLTVQQMVQHAHVPWDKDRFAKALVQFRRALPDAEWSRFTDTMSRYLPRARMSGSDGEFYFDGRSIPDGLGFNGGIILRDKEFSVHT